MMMPSGPAPDFIIAHPQQLLAVFTARFDGPPHAAHVPQGFQRRVNRSMAQGALQLLRLDVPPQHQPDLRTGPRVPHSDHPYGSKLRYHGSLAAFFDRLACPRLSGQRPCHFPPGRAYASAGGGWPGALARLAWCGALRYNTTGPAPRRHPDSPGCPHTPRPPRPTDTAAPGSGPLPRASPAPTRAWL